MRTAITITASLWLLSSYWTYPAYSRLHLQGWTMDEFGADFHVYYQAAKGNYHWSETIVARDSTIPHASWYYPNWTANIFKPFTVLPFESAFTIWFTINLLCSILIIWKLSATFYGKFFVFILLKPLYWMLSAGNIAPILGALCVTEIGVVLAALVKPYLAILLLLHWHIARRREGSSVLSHLQTAIPRVLRNRFAHSPSEIIPAAEHGNHHPRPLDAPLVGEDAQLLNEGRI